MRGSKIRDQDRSRRRIERRERGFRILEPFLRVGVRSATEVALEQECYALEARLDATSRRWNRAIDAISGEAERLLHQVRNGVPSDKSGQTLRQGVAPEIEQHSLYPLRIAGGEGQNHMDPKTSQCQ